MKIHEHNATDIVAKLTTGEIATEQVFKHQQARIEKLNNRYNAFVHLAGKPQAEGMGGLLKGLPISVKDQIHVAGMPCTSGYQDLQNFVPERDAPVIASLRSAGAQILGKTNLPPLAMDFQTYNSLHGKTLNPWNTDFTAGGSSGGGAAALAAGLSFLDIGADLAGSLRIPASFCGVCSLVPSVGRVSTQGSMTLLEQANIRLDYLPRIGPMARHVEDLALFWQVVNGEKPISKTEAKLAFLPFMSELPLHPQISKTMDSLKQYLSHNNQTQVTVAAPKDFSWYRAWQAYGIIQGYQLGEMIPFWQRFIGRLLSRSAINRSPNFIKPIQDGYRRKHKEYMQALEAREQLAKNLDEFLGPYDAWILPVTLVPAFKHIEASFESGFVRDYDHSFEINGQDINYFEALTRLTTPFNLTGHPVVTIPVGRDEKSNVPIGIQLIGKRNMDKELIATAALIQQLTSPSQYEFKHIQ